LNTDVEDHLDPGVVKCPHHGLELDDRVLDGVAGGPAAYQASGL